MDKPRGPLTLLATSRSLRRWTAVGAMLPLLYLASFGPACWTVSQLHLTPAIINTGYRPVLLALDEIPKPAVEFVIWYSKLGITDDSMWLVNMCGGGNYTFSSR